MMNKLFIAALIVILGVQIRADPPEALEQTKFIEDSKCLQQEKLEFKDVLAFAVEDKIELAEKNPKLKCFASCLMDYAKILNGCKVVFDISSDGGISSAEKDKFVKLIESCKDAVSATDRCECGFQMVKCLAEKR